MGSHDWMREALELEDVPGGWGILPLKALAKRRTVRGCPDAQLLSVYRDYGVVPKSSRSDNYNKASQNLENYLHVRPGDLVINKMKAWQGSVAVSAHDGIVSPAYFTFEVDPGIHARFLHYLLRSYRYARWYARISKGIRPNQWDLDIDVFTRTPTLVPPLSTQRAIADFLDRKTAAIDELIRKKERLIELLQEKRQALITQAVTKGLDRNVPMKDSGIEWLGEIPVHWEVRRLKEIATRVVVGVAQAATHAYADTGIPIVRSTNIRANFISLNELLFIRRDFAETLRSKFIRPGDMLTVRTGNAGVTAVVPAELSLSQCFTMLITSLCAEHSPQFASYSLNSNLGQTYFGIEAWGTAQKNISVPILKETPIALPPPQEQREVVERLAKLLADHDRVDGLLRRQVEVLGEYRQALISAAVTGQLDIPEPRP